MKEHILVTGGAGYLGSTLVPLLLKNNYRVTVLDNFLFSQSSLLDCCSDANFQIVRGDCRDKTLLEMLMKDADIIIPLAAIVGAPACKMDETAARSINFDAIQTILSLRTPQQKIIYPTTNSGYGIGEKNKFCTEESPLRPISLYGVTKVEAEKTVLNSGNSITFRLATVFGLSPRMRIDLLVNDFVHRAVMDRFAVLFDAHAKRNFIHVRDVARAFLHAIENFDTMKGEAYNVGLSDANLSKAELCEEIKKFLPDFVYSEAEIGEDPDKRDYIVSNEKIHKTGFQPAFGLQDGIRELIKGYSILRNARYSNV